MADPEKQGHKQGGLCLGTLARSRACAGAFAVFGPPAQLQPVPNFCAEGWQTADGLHHDLRSRLWY